MTRHPNEPTPIQWAVLIFAAPICAVLVWAFTVGSTIEQLTVM